MIFITKAHFDALPDKVQRALQDVEYVHTTPYGTSYAKRALQFYPPHMLTLLDSVSSLITEHVNLMEKCDQQKEQISKFNQLKEAAKLVRELGLE